jgi:hypothetical protein
VTVKPDLQSIAREVGRIEQKTARLLNGEGKLPGGGNLEDGFDWLRLLGVLADLLERLEVDTSAGEYPLSSPCIGEDQLGSPTNPVLVPYPATNSPLAAIARRIDAVAQLLQVHKDLKQPMCTPGRAVGQPVTVTFEEVEGS